MQSNAKRSASQMDKDTNVSVTSIRRRIKNDLKLILKMRKRQYLTPLQKQKTLHRAKVFHRDLKTETVELEIEFTIEASVNNQNYRLYGKSSAVIDEFIRTVYHHSAGCFLKK